jgi:pyruvate kinase
VQEVYVTSEYDKKGNEKLIACSYANLAKDVKPGSKILCADGSLVLTVEETFPEKNCVKCRCVNSAAIGYASSHASRLHQLAAPQYHCNLQRMRKCLQLLP